MPSNLAGTWVGSVGCYTRLIGWAVESSEPVEMDGMAGSRKRIIFSSVYVNLPIPIEDCTSVSEVGWRRWLADLRHALSLWLLPRQGGQSYARHLKFAVLCCALCAKTACVSTPPILPLRCREESS